MSSTSGPDLNSSEQIRQELLRLNTERQKLEQQILTFEDLLRSVNLSFF